MFKNPLKYQQGGKTQNALGQLVKWLVQNTGLDENQVSQRLNQILSDDTAKQELVNNLQNMQKGDQNAAQNIIGMFVPQSAKFGGKIHDFICKHAKGGALKGCGCKQEGGNVEKHQQENGKGRGKIYTYDDTYTSGKVTSPGDTLITGSYPSKNQEMHITPTGTMWRQWDRGDMFPSKTYVNQKWYENRPTRYWLYRNLGIGPDIATGTEPLVTNMYDAKNNHRNNWIEQKETGGKVEKAQKGKQVLGPNGKPVPKIPFSTSDGTLVDPKNIESLAKYYNTPFVRRDFNNPAGYAVERIITVYPNGQRDTTGIYNPANLSSIELEQMKRGEDIKTQALRQHFNKPGVFRAKK